MTTQVRLCNDDFIALRSLARGRWVQGREIEWKVNRTWLCMSFTSAALDAAFRLVQMGLAENFVCCPTCGEVFQLTQAGRERASQIDREPVKAPDQPPKIEVRSAHSGGWLRGLMQLFTKHSRT
ncbi:MULTISPECIES: hypothetical protein [Pseudomonas]|uniref:hypothetical protein n=1 Tax=Pseudomonas TaxID=286 RepID=UPI000AE1F9DA|nr:MULTISPECIES: hypothetical protein [Pseudomonas]